MIHREYNHAEIDDMIVWTVGRRQYRARVHDIHRSGLILKLRGMYTDYPWDVLDMIQPDVIPCEDVRGMTP